MGAVIKGANGIVIGIAGGTAVKIASEISGVAGGGAGDAYIASKGLLKGVDVGGIIANLFKVKLS